jgi:quercetin dioxygenase-like cupin family protein
LSSEPTGISDQRGFSPCCLLSEACLFGQRTSEKGVNGMFNSPRKTKLVGSLIVATLLTSSTVVVSAALAGECPADQKRPNAREAVDFKPVGVTDTVIASIDVAKAPFNINDRLFRMRKLTIEPNGIVPWHSHADRPAIIYIIEGEINEYASNCTVPILHKAGDVVAETPEVSHWWKNLSDKTVALISADLLKDKNDHNM